jgi:hypothetical protein
MQNLRTWSMQAVVASLAALSTVALTSQPTAAEPDPGISSAQTSNGVAESRASSNSLPVFTVSSSTLHQISAGLRPYEGTGVTPPGGFGTVDEQGVRMFKFPGSDTSWNHPVAQAQYAIANLNSYRLTGSRAYLTIAAANAQRLVDRAVTVGDAWFFPYDFDFALYGDLSQELRAPWYSAMAEGQALSVFTRLWQVTGDAKWRDAMDHTAASFQVEPSADAPFVTRVDSDQHLWFEEYPRYPSSHSERVLNGHIFSIFGLYDYWSATGQPADVARLILGGISTVERTALSAFRRPKRSSVYSLNHARPAGHYHAVHIAQFLLLWRMTHAPAWLTRAQTFEFDYPLPRTHGVAVLRRGVKQRMYRLDQDLKIKRSRVVRLKRKKAVEFTSHVRTADGGPVVMRISSGRFKGWSVAEAPRRAWALGAIDRHDYAPRPRVVLPAGHYAAVRLGSRGGVQAKRVLTLSRSSSFVASAQATVRGSRAFYARNGTLAGYWVFIGRGVRLVGDTP